MVEGNGVPALFSPIAVLRQSLTYTAANLVSIVLWALPPLVYGLGFHFLRPALPGGGGDGQMTVSALLVLGFILLWIRVPMEVRLIRSVLLGEVPKQFYGLELLEKRTWSYTWAYVRVMCLVVAMIGPAFVLAAQSLGMITGAPEAGANAGSTAGLSLLGSVALLVLIYLFLAPRVVTAFPDVALGGKGFLFNTGRLGELARKARWRIVAVMAVVWAPEHVLNLLSFVYAESPWWQALADQWWFALVAYVVGFATLVFSCVAGAFIYGHLRAALARMSREAQEAQED